MSRIFDALLRSEYERAGASKTVTRSAQTLLEHAERQAASQRRGEITFVPGRKYPSAPPKQLGASDGEGAKMPAEAGISEFTSGEAIGHEILLDQFLPRSVSLPRNSRLVCLTEKGCAAAEAFRLLGVRVRKLRSERSLKKIVITSTTPQEGKSTIASNLACCLAEGEQRSVLLVDGDLRRPVLAEMFGLGPEPGLCEYLRGENSLAGSIYKLNGPDLWFLPAGASLGNPLESLQSARLPALMEALGDLFDWIIIDSPPVLPLADTSIWERWADGILLVTRQGVTRKLTLQRGLEAFQSPDKLIGALINSFDALPESDYYYYRSDQEHSSSARS